MDTHGRSIFNLAVLVAVASAVWMAVAGNWDATFRFAVIAVIMLGSRSADVPTPFAAAFAVFLLLATWAAVQHWYQQVSQFDALVHFLTPGSLAAVAYFVLVRARLLPAPRDFPHLRSWAPVLWVTVVGMAAAVVWEFYEWIVEQVSPAYMTVGYADTLLDLVTGTLGSLVAGGFVLLWARRHGSRLSSAGSSRAA